MKKSLIVCFVNVVLCVLVGLLVGGDLGGGAAFLAGFIALVVEWIFIKDEHVPAAAVVGLLLGVIIVCLYGI